MLVSWWSVQWRSIKVRIISTHNIAHSGVLIRSIQTTARHLRKGEYYIRWPYAINKAYMHNMRVPHFALDGSHWSFGVRECLFTTTGRHSSLWHANCGTLTYYIIIIVFLIQILATSGCNNLLLPKTTHLLCHIRDYLQF